jgi:hypothetical protein
MHLVLVFIFLIRLARNANGDLGMEGSLWSDMPSTNEPISLGSDPTLFGQPGLFNADEAGNLFTSTSNNENFGSLDSDEPLDWTALAVNDGLKSSPLLVDNSLNSNANDLPEPQFLANEPNCLFGSSQGFNKRNDQCAPPLIDKTKPNPEGQLPRIEPDPDGLQDPNTPGLGEEIERFERGIREGVSKGRIRQYPPMIPRYKNDPEDPCDGGQFAVCDTGLEVDRYLLPSGLYGLFTCELCRYLNQFEKKFC